MVPLTSAYVALGTKLTVRGLLPWIAGGAAALLLFALPRWIERYDLLGMRRLLEHGDEGSSAGARSAGSDPSDERSPVGSGVD